MSGEVHRYISVILSFPGLFTISATLAPCTTRSRLLAMNSSTNDFNNEGEKLRQLSHLLLIYFNLLVERAFRKQHLI
jgi:hypothetical protein